MIRKALLLQCDCWILIPDVRGMTVESGEKGEGRCVLVGLRMDGDGRELLSWALGKVAKKGDRIVAVLVSRSQETNDNSTLSLIKVLDQYLSVYEGFCNLKQVVLVGRVSRGISARKVLVKEAALCRAGTVVVGVGKNLSFGGSTSLAKYCAKKLPPTTALIALQNGKIVFESGATKMTPGREPKPILHSLLHPSVGMGPKVIIPSCRTMSDIVNSRLSDASSGDSLKGEVTNNCNLLVCERTVSDDPGSISALVRELPDTPGWPLRRSSLEHVETPQDSKARKMSVVQWAMTLPDRTSPLIRSHTDRDSSSVEFPKELERIIKDNSSSCRWLRYRELRSSTNQFSSEALIGKGGSSQVYKGCFPSGEQVAVKLSKLSKVASSDDFLLEIDILTTLRHDHVVPLKGICIEDDHIISVYNYFSRGSLEENLHGKRAKPSLTWDKRFKVAIGIADALSYLHDGCSRPVIHRDVKSSNILLSEEFEPQLSDFNLALWAPTTSSYLTYTNVLGTFGYLAPEYFMYGRVSDKIDVYAFGVVLLELLSGRKPISDENPKGQESLVMWAKPILERGDIAELLDPNLDREFIDEEQMSRIALAASLCITTASSLRPRMRQILSILRGEEEVEAWMNSRNLSALNGQDDEAYPASSIRSHIGLAFQDVDDDSSVTSSEQNNPCSLEDYLQGRWSRSSSFD